MGGICSRGMAEQHSTIKEKSLKFSGKLNKKNRSVKKDEDAYFHTSEEFENISSREGSGELRVPFSSELKPSTPAKSVATKVPLMSSFIGRAGTAGLERAVDVLDTLGSSMSNFNSGSGFISGFNPKGNRIDILAFEVANTIVKGSNLLQSLSEENIQFLKKEVLHCEGVSQLVSTDMDVLLRIAAADKREEFDIFVREVIRFGDRCKDPQWHNLGRFFSKLDTDPTTQKQSREEAESAMQELISLAQHTSELYHEWQALDRFEQDYQRKFEEMESLHLPRTGESFMMLQSELKHQRKLVKSLQKKSLWSKYLGEVLEKLVDVVIFIHQAIHEAFESNGTEPVSDEPNQQTLGKASLALHYANIISQIDNIVSRPTCLPSNIRDTLYNALSNDVKAALRSRLQTAHTDVELTIPQIKEEMEKTLQWLAPVATNTTKAHQGFGWVGEWANTGGEFGKKAASTNNLIRLQTLYHANIQKTDMCILELVEWLNRLISQVRQRDDARKPLSLRSPTCKGLAFDSSKLEQSLAMQLSQEDKKILEGVSWKRLVIRRSKSQGTGMSRARGGARVHAWRSAGSSPSRVTGKSPRAGRGPEALLDVMDGLDRVSF